MGIYKLILQRLVHLNKWA